MPLTAQEVIETQLLKIKKEADELRMDEAQKKLDLYKDDYEEIIQDKMTELFTKANYDRMKYHVNQTQNILKRVINEISMIYKAEPQRIVDPENDRWSEIMKDNRLDLKLKKINRYTNLMNECLLKISYRGGKIVYDVIAPNICFVFQNDFDPTQADAIVYMMTWADTRGKTTIEYHYWSVDGDYFVFNENFRLIRVVYSDIDEKEENYPYRDPKTDLPILPFIVFHRQEPDCNFWDQDSGRDLYNGAVLTGVKMTLFDYYFKVCSFKQPYIIGDISNMPQDQIMDPMTALGVPAGEGASIGTLDIQINMDQLVKAIVFQINGLINNYGISADQYTLRIPEMSGRALKIRNRALMELRQDQLPLYRNYEQEIFYKTRIVNNAFPKFFTKIPEDAEFMIDFGEIEFPEDPEDELRLDIKESRAGLMSPGQFYMKRNPDIKDEAEAEKRIGENIKKWDRLFAKYPTLDEAMDIILGREIERKEPGEGEE